MVEWMAPCRVKTFFLQKRPDCILSNVIDPIPNKTRSFLQKVAQKNIHRTLRKWTKKAPVEGNVPKVVTNTNTCNSIALHCMQSYAPKYVHTLKNK